MSPTRFEEIELKLLVPTEDLSRLWRHPRVAELTLGAPSVQTLESVYFDTADFDLARSGLVLRIRSGEGETLQTVKTRGGGSAGLFQRGEWESPVTGEVPDLSRLADSELRARIEGTLAGRELTPILRTAVRRAQRIIGTADWEARFELDVGESKTTLGSHSICELELELVRGDPGPLYTLALDLHEEIDLRPSTVSKSERGLASLLGESAKPKKARRPELKAEDDLDKVLVRTLESCLEQIAGNEEAVIEGRDPEGVHQMRVGVRRLRSALSLFSQAIPEESRRFFRAELRWLAGSLGDARDLDVFLSETLEPMAPSAPESAEFGRIVEIARGMREDAYTRARAALASRRYGGLLLALGAWGARRGWRDQPLTPKSAQLFSPARISAEELLQRRYRKVRKRARDVRHLDIPAAHELRMELKKLRYACEFLRDLYPHHGADGFVRRLARLQESLGHLNDQSTAADLMDRILRRLGPEVTPRHLRVAGFVTGWTARVAVEKLTPLPKQWKRFKKQHRFWSSSG